jgi:hypothetical protein
LEAGVEVAASAGVDLLLDGLGLVLDGLPDAVGLVGVRGADGLGANEAGALLVMEEEGDAVEAERLARGDAREHDVEGLVEVARAEHVVGEGLKDLEVGGLEGEGLEHLGEVPGVEQLAEHPAGGLGDAMGERVGAEGAQARLAADEDGGRPVVGVEREPLEPQLGSEEGELEELTSGEGEGAEVIGEVDLEGERHGEVLEDVAQVGGHGGHADGPVEHIGQCGAGLAHEPGSVAERAGGRKFLHPEGSHDVLHHDLALTERPSRVAPVTGRRATTDDG